MGICIVNDCGEKTLARKKCRKHYDIEYRHEHYIKNRERAIAESSERRRAEREDILLSSNNGRCSTDGCTNSIDPNQKRSWFYVDGKVFCKNCWFERKKIGRFSRNFDACVECGSSTKKHLGHGYCSSCFPAFRRKNSKQS